MSALFFVANTSGVSAQSDSAQSFYTSNLDDTVQGRCAACHVSGGQASGSGLLFTGSPSANHQAFVNYVNQPTVGARSQRLLSSIRGGSGHPGGAQVPEGTATYNLFVEYVTLLTTPDEPDPVFRATLEEPINGEIHSGVGNLRGWAVSSAGIKRVEIEIGGATFEAPYGSDRGDVGAAFPDVTDSAQSGFSLAYAYSLLDAGEHTAVLRATNNNDEVLEVTSTFTVAKFNTDFVLPTDEVNLGNASCAVSGDEISIVDGSIAGTLYDFTMKWRTAEQGFEIIDVR
jgi:hypothetical protein